MKTSTLFFSLAVSTALASPIQPRATSSTCNVQGIAVALPINIALGKGTYDACSALCIANTKCNSFSFGLNTCTLYGNPIAVIKLTTGIFFYDKTCLSAATTTTAARVVPTTTTAPVLNIPLPTTLPISVALPTSLVNQVTSLLTVPSPTTTLINVQLPTSTLLNLPLTSVLPTVDVCVAVAVVNPLSTGSCGKLTGGTTVSEMGSSSANSPADCAMECAQNKCQSFGYFDGMCSLYGTAVSGLNVDANTGIYNFYDSSCYIATFCDN